jgi:hypothetical protein
MPPQQKGKLASGSVERMLKEKTDNVGASQLESACSELFYTTLHPRDKVFR